MSKDTLPSRPGPNVYRMAPLTSNTDLWYSESCIAHRYSANRVRWRGSAKYSQIVRLATINKDKQID